MKSEKQKESDRRWYQANKERIKAKRKEYYKNNREVTLLKMKEYVKNNPEKKSSSDRKWRQNNKEKVNKYFRDYYKNNIQYKISHLIRTRLNCAINLQYKTGSSIEYIGCTIIELMNHLENQFRDGMTWQNHGKIWHIDHIIALYKFDLTDDKEIKKASHYTNLQPLLVKENLKKNRF